MQQTRGAFCNHIEHRIGPIPWDTRKLDGLVDMVGELDSQVWEAVYRTFPGGWRWDAG